MAQSLPELPLELLLDILEWLLALGGKANHRSAAYLAQSCRLLRTSEAGKRARYIHALARHAMSVPQKLPKNLQYETEVLETASWPPQALLAQPEEGGTAGLHDVSESFLEADGIIALAPDRQGLLYFERVPEASSISPSPRSQATCSEGSVLRRTIPLHSRVCLWAADREAARAVLYHRHEELEVFEIWNLQSGVCEGTLELDESSGREQYGEILELDTEAQFLLIRRGDYAEVRYMPSKIDADSGLPVVWSFAPPEQDRWYALGASLLSPHFVSVIACSDDENVEDIQLNLRIYRLESSPSRLLAVISLPLLSRGPISHIVCGASLVPEAEGLAVIAVMGDIYLLSTFTLVEILYADASDEGKYFDKSWFKKHTKKVRTFAEDTNPIWPSVSGWRCALSFIECRGCDKKGRMFMLLDTSASRSESGLGSLHVREQRVRKYFPSESAEDASTVVVLFGCRLLLHSDSEHRTVIWRL